MDDNFNLLNSRLINNCDPKLLASQDWSTIPIIVSDNVAKDCLNIHVINQFAQATGQSAHWYYAKDSWKGKIIQDLMLVAQL